MRSIRILKIGDFNPRSGPDFTHCLLKIGEDILEGDIEFDVNSSNWFKHGHYKNPVFNNVILQICVYADHHPLRLENSEGKRIMYSVINPEILDSIRELKIKKKTEYDRKLMSAFMPCHKLFSREVYEFSRISDKLLLMGAKRMILKAKFIKHLDSFRLTFKESFCRQLFLFLGKPHHFDDFINISEMVDWKEFVLNPTQGLIKLKGYLLEAPVKRRFCGIRPVNYPLNRFKKSFELFESGICMDLLYELEDLYSRKTAFPESWFAKMDGAFRESGFSVAYAGLLLVNVMIPVIMTYFPIWKRDVMAYYKKMPGYEDNRVVNKWKSIFLEKTIRMGEQLEQGFLYLDRKHCKKACAGCPLLVLENNQFLGKSGIVEYEPLN